MEDEDGDEGPGPLHQAAGFQVGPPRLLGGHNFIRLLDEGGDKAQGDGHHHGKLVDREVKALEGIHQPLDTVGEGDGGGGVGEEGGSGDEADDAHRHKDSGVDSLPGDFDNPPLPQDLSIHKEHIQHRGEDDDGNHRLQAFENHHQGNLADEIGPKAQHHPQP